LHFVPQSVSEPPAPGEQVQNFSQIPGLSKADEAIGCVVPEALGQIAPGYRPRCDHLPSRRRRPKFSRAQLENKSLRELGCRSISRTIGRAHDGRYGFGDFRSGEEMNKPYRSGMLMGSEAIKINLIGITRPIHIYPVI
jgi:hypothetical protein